MDDEYQQRVKAADEGVITVSVFKARSGKLFEQERSASISNFVSSLILDVYDGVLDHFEAQQQLDRFLADWE